MQEKIQQRAFALEKIQGPVNPADSLTEHIDRNTLTRLMPVMSLQYADGRAELAPHLSA